MKIRDIPSEECRHRKKSKTSSKSNSSKRADHKHQYERIILKWICGFRWAKRCAICGRVDDSFGGFSSARYQDFIRPAEENRSRIVNHNYLSIPEIRTKYPSIDIYKIDDRALHGGWAYILIEDDNEEA